MLLHHATEHALDVQQGQPPTRAADGVRDGICVRERSDTTDQGEPIARLIMRSRGDHHEIAGFDLCGRAHATAAGTTPMLRSGTKMTHIQAGMPRQRQLAESAMLEISSKRATTS